MAPIGGLRPEGTLMRIVIADAGPLIALARVQQLELLHRLFGVVWITEVIASELGLQQSGLAGGSFRGLEQLQQASRQGWLSIAPPNGIADSYQPINPGVDAGEASAIGVALQQQASGTHVLVLIDDRCGRAEARRQGLPIIGLAAVLVLARESGLISACAPLLQALRKEGYYLSDRLVESVLQQVGEC